jgi:hypothetical protein
MLDELACEIRWHVVNRSAFLVCDELGEPWPDRVLRWREELLEDVARQLAARAARMRKAGGEP